MPCSSLGPTDKNLPLPKLMLHTRRSPKLLIQGHWGDERNGTYTLMKIDKSPLNIFGHIHTGWENYMIKQWANSQLVITIIPKEALAGLLTLAKQVCDSHPLVQSSSQALYAIQCSVKEAHCFTVKHLSWSLGALSGAIPCTQQLMPWPFLVTWAPHGPMPWCHPLLLATGFVCHIPPH